jgi:hypothetical protein
MLQAPALAGASMDILSDATWFLQTAGQELVHRHVAMTPPLRPPRLVPVGNDPEAPA